MCVCTVTVSKSWPSLRQRNKWCYKYGITNVVEKYVIKNRNPGYNVKLHFLWWKHCELVKGEGENNRSTNEKHLFTHFFLFLLFISLTDWLLYFAFYIFHSSLKRERGQSIRAEVWDIYFITLPPSGFICSCRQFDKINFVLLLLCSGLYHQPKVKKSSFRKSNPCHILVLSVHLTQGISLIS